MLNEHSLWGKDNTAYWNADHSDNTEWRVKWGFDSGDCFCIFPLLPKRSSEHEIDRWNRSFVPLRDENDMLCIESSVVEALLRRILEAKFDANLSPNNSTDDSWRKPHFEWYSENAYSIDDCKTICAQLTTASEKLQSLPDDALVYLDNMGDVVTCSSANGDSFCQNPIYAVQAFQDCEIIAELLGKVVSFAEKHGAVISFSGP